MSLAFSGPQGRWCLWLQVLIHSEKFIFNKSFR